MVQFIIGKLGFTFSEGMAKALPHILVEVEEEI